MGASSGGSEVSVGSARGWGVPWGMDGARGMGEKGHGRDGGWAMVFFFAFLAVDGSDLSIFCSAAAVAALTDFVLL